ncbi:hypothetical protein GNI_068900 [Gregarina niphandrodes]|uniref:Transmembrane protein n=1 Tax=Gregarina niphandrodes TaxID=110365 RepID=A0A023B7J9_GRENI|nr:hypothetical protein GNI_068900 [Gregarina niphandrodes]EZG67415.1 hypothetical protein GNI_068900 [Gregarina niphandrodes]|eukprot:XP_011130248.1 hypothetical protein GNI_068900 [Gregarina niphandrodes]
MRFFAASLLATGFASLTDGTPEYQWLARENGRIEEILGNDYDFIVNGVLVDELLDYLKQRNTKMPEQDLEMLAATVQMIEGGQADEQSAEMWRYLMEKLDRALGPNDPLIIRLDASGIGWKDLSEEQLLGGLLSGSTSPVALTRTLLELKVAARAQALSRMNATGVGASQALLDEIWYRPYQVLRRTPVREPRKGFSATDAYCKAYGLYRCTKGLRYGLGGNVTLPDLSEDDDTDGSVTSPGGSVGVPGGSGPTDSPQTTGAEKGEELFRFGGKYGDWGMPNATAPVRPSPPPYSTVPRRVSAEPPDDTSQLSTPYPPYYPPYLPYPPYPQLGHHGRPPWVNSIQIGSGVAPTVIPPLGGVLSPIVLGPPALAETGRKNPLAMLSAPFEQLKSRWGHHHHSSPQPLTYIYPLPVAVATESIPSPTGLPASRVERPPESDTPLYDSILRRAQRLNSVVDSVAEVPIVGPAAILLNGAANVGRDAVLTVIEAANAFSSDDFTSPHTDSDLSSSRDLLYRRR